MCVSILIVEDLFIEANDLRIILQRAGHTICGICKSVDQALSVLKKEKPDVVLLDIFLKGDLTGIHLAKILSGRNIPFIFLSANSNPSILEAARNTQPHGFLVKPFREKDVLVALDIADYRHRQTVQLVQRQERWLSHLLVGVINEVASLEQKLVLLARAFQHIIPFEFIFIDTDTKGESLQSLYGFRRIDLDEYKNLEWPEFLKKTKLTPSDMLQQRKNNVWRKEAMICNGADFSAFCFKERVADRLKTVYDLQSGFYLPILAGEQTSMSVSFYSTRPDAFRPDHAELISPLRGLIATVLQNIRYQKKEEGVWQQPERQPVVEMPGIIGRSPKLLHILDMVRQVAAYDTTVLITGETGVGKEGLASAIHRLSGRKHKPLIKVNCAAIPESLIESELFGHEKGAFTTALDRRIGKFEQASGGTIFLDEIGELPLQVQSKLLRVLQEKEIERIGGRTTIKVDVRIIAATNRNLHQEVAEGRFRMDLYYRINVFLLDLPPLRQRREDIPMLVDYFLAKYAVVSGGQPKKMAIEAMQQLVGYSWPGNIRELQHLVERHVLITRGDIIPAIELPDEPGLSADNKREDMTLRAMPDMNKSEIVTALKKCNGKVSGKGGAAELLGVNPNTLTSRMKRLGISWQYILK